MTKHRCRWGRRMIDGITLLLFAVLLVGCTETVRTQVIRVGDYAPVKFNNVLALRLAEVSLPKMDIEDAISAIRGSDLGLSTNGKKLVFSCFFSFSRTDGPNRYRRRRRNVVYHGKDVTLREVLDSICKQAGWSYRPIDGMIEFIDDRRYRPGTLTIQTS